MRERRWVLPVLAAAAGFLLVLYGNRVTSLIVAAIAACFLVALTTTWLYPKSTTDAEARAKASELNLPLIYWRPGCSFCLRLRLNLLARRTRAVWMNVDADEAASRRVKAVNDGNETVPTAFVGAESRTNPSASWVSESGA